MESLQFGTSYVVERGSVQLGTMMWQAALDWALMDFDSTVQWYINSTATGLLNEAEAQRRNTSIFADDAAFSSYVDQILSNQEAVLKNFFRRNIAACRSHLERLNRVGSKRIGTSDDLVMPERLVWTPQSTGTHELRGWCAVCVFQSLNMDLDLYTQLHADANALQANITWPHVNLVSVCHGGQCECSQLADIIEGAIKNQLEQMNLHLRNRLVASAGRDPIGREAVMKSVRQRLQLQVRSRKTRSYHNCT